MALKVPCPHCGLRPYTEFTFGGQLREIGPATPQEDFERVYLEANAAGEQDERWYHAFGCRRWFQVERHTVTNTITPTGGAAAGGTR